MNFASLDIPNDTIALLPSRVWSGVLHHACAIASRDEARLGDNSVCWVVSDDQDIAVVERYRLNPDKDLTWTRFEKRSQVNEGELPWAGDLPCLVRHCLQDCSLKSLK